MKICLATLHAKPQFTPLAILYLKAHLLEHQGYAFDAVQILEFTQESGEQEIIDAPSVRAGRCLDNRPLRRVNYRLQAHAFSPPDHLLSARSVDGLSMHVYGAGDHGREAPLA